MLKLRNAALGLVLVSSSIMSFSTHAGASANVGFVTDYYFRGAELGDAGAYAGLDFDAAGFYVGTWLINDGGEDETSSSTIEYDIYAGYDYEFESGFSVGVAYTTFNYEYSPTFQAEGNLYLGYGPISLEFTTGEDDVSNDEYDFIALSISGDVFGATYGTTDFDDPETPLDLSDDFGTDYDYLELSAGTDFDFGEAVGPVSVSVVLGAAESDDPSVSTDVYLFLDISKSFDF